MLRPALFLLRRPGMPAWVPVVMATLSLLLLLPPGTSSRSLAQRAAEAPSSLLHTAATSPDGRSCVTSCAQLPDGNYPACHEDCSRYVICQRHVLRHVICPGGLAFDSASATCVSRDPGLCIDLEEGQRQADQKTSVGHDSAPWPHDSSSSEGSPVSQVQPSLAAPLHRTPQLRVEAGGGRAGFPWLQRSLHHPASSSGRGGRAATESAQSSLGLLPPEGPDVSTKTASASLGQALSSAASSQRSRAALNDRGQFKTRAGRDTKKSPMFIDHDPVHVQPQRQTLVFAEPRALKGVGTHLERRKRSTAGEDVREAEPLPPAYLTKQTKPGQYSAKVRQRPDAMPQMAILTLTGSKPKVPQLSVLAATKDQDQAAREASSASSGRDALDQVPFLRLGATLTNMVNKVVESAFRSLRIRGFDITTTTTTPAPTTTTPASLLPTLWRLTPLSGIVELFSDIMNMVSSVLETLLHPPPLAKLLFGK